LDGKLFFLLEMPPYRTQNQRPPPQPRNELVEWYYSIPPVTRALMTAGVVVPMAPVLGIAGMHSLLLVWKPVFEKFQARLVMCSASYIKRFSCSYLLISWNSYGDWLRVSLFKKLISI
jgi:hypothetical protein